MGADIEVEVYSGRLKSANYYGAVFAQLGLRCSLHIWFVMPHSTRNLTFNVVLADLGFSCCEMFVFCFSLQHMRNARAMIPSHVLPHSPGLDEITQLSIHHSSELLVQRG